MKTNQTQSIIVYGHPFCGDVFPVRRILRAARVPHKYVDILLNPDARRHVAEINNGNLSVPTLIFPDNSTLTEPQPALLESKLKSLGYRLGSASFQPVTLWGAIRSPLTFITFLIVLYAIFDLIGSA